MTVSTNIIDCRVHKRDRKCKHNFGLTFVVHDLKRQNVMYHKRLEFCVVRKYFVTNDITLSFTNFYLPHLCPMLMDITKLDPDIILGSVVCGHHPCHLILQIKLLVVAERDVNTGQTCNTMRVLIR